ncbi:MAG: hypothetical protein V4515_07910 [Chloroflexota bacterium]
MIDQAISDRLATVRLDTHENGPEVRPLGQVCGRQDEDAVPAN